MRYKPMSESQTQLFASIYMFEKNDKISFDKIYNENEKSFISKVIEKRIEVFKLPKFEPSAIILIEILSEGVAGRAVLAMIETLEKLKEGLIDMSFISQEVYPLGFYIEKEFIKEFKIRKEQHKFGFNFLIG